MFSLLLRAALEGGTRKSVFWFLANIHTELRPIWLVAARTGCPYIFLLFLLYMLYFFHSLRFLPYVCLYLIHFMDFIDVCVYAKKRLIYLIEVLKVLFNYL